MKNKLLLLCMLFSLLTWGCSANNNQPAATVSSEAMNYSQLAITAITKLSQERFNKFVDLCDEHLSNEISASEFKLIWSELLTTYGTFQYYDTNFSITYQNGYAIADIICTFEQGQVTVRLSFNSSGQLSGFFLLENTHNEKVSQRLSNDVDIVFGEGDWILNGSLTIPEGSGTFPVVLLVHTQGVNDRNEQIGPNLPFLDIAQQLAEYGIATLRYDNRAYTYPIMTTELMDQTVQEMIIDDVIEALDFLYQHPRISSEQIYIAGHSLGGMLIPKIAEETPLARGYFILAGNIRPLQDILVEQTEYVLSIDQTTDIATKKALLEDALLAKNKIDHLSTTDDFSTNELFGYSCTYWLELNLYDPFETASTITRPLFIAQGGRDFQVTTVDFNIWKSLPNSNDIQYHYYDNLNHFFMPGVGKSNPAEYQTKNNVSTLLTSDMADFIKYNELKR